MNGATTYNDATPLYNGSENMDTTSAGVNAASTGAPGKNPSSWDPLDDLLLRHLKEIKKMGWKEISQYFDNRTPNACQFRWRRLKSGNLKSNRTALVDVSVFPGKIEIKNANAGSAASSSQRKRSGSVSPPRAYPNTTGTAAPAPAAYPNATAPYGCPQLPEGQVAGPGVPLPMAMAQMPVVMAQTPGIPVAMAQGPAVPMAMPQMPLPLPVALPPPQHTGNANAIQLPLPVPQGGNPDHEHRENAGFVPKVFVKSRRSSSIVPVQQVQGQFGHPLSPQSSISSTVSSTVSEASLSTALNTTLPGSKSRKNSFTSWGWGATGTRRPSATAPLALPLPHPHSSGPSRRSSMILQGSAPHAPTALSKERRESIILREYNERKNSLVAPHEAGANAPLFPNQYTFADAPAPGQGKAHAQLRSLSNLSAYSSTSTLESHAQPPVVPLSRGSVSAQWTPEEEQLLSDARARRMSAVELSLVLPARSKEEIEHKLRAMQGGSDHSPARSASLSPRKPLSVGQLAMQAAGQDDDAVDPLHSHHGISRSSTASSSKDVSPGSFAADDTVSTTPSSATSVSTAGRAGKPSAIAGKQGPHGLHGALLQSRTGSNGNPPLPSISSIFQNMV
ncbi:Dot6 protein [Maudiozyma humilis]|uniref:Dot6 protein n=1 Tax=Maudiozyma humilis TaxID=51915 RepID=A0AAV5RVF3_MAUHU|nr:Dot6 protein [Kazachstania humilis]